PILDYLFAYTTLFRSEYESMIYVVTGAMRMEFGPGGREVLEAVPGDFLYVAPGAIQRESNPTEQESHIVVARSGSGEPVFNVHEIGRDTSELQSHLNL